MNLKIEQTIKQMKKIINNCYFKILFLYVFLSIVKRYKKKLKSIKLV